MRVATWSNLDRGAAEQAARRARPSRTTRALAASVADDHRARARAKATPRCSTSRRSSTACELDSLEVGDAEIRRVRQRASAPQQRAAIRRRRRNIETFHRPQLPTPIAVDTAPGVRCERVSRPIDSVGLYVPAGTAPLPSTALMLGVPARLAGCATRVLCSPVQADGRVDAAVLYAARVAGVQRVFKLGGAQADRGAGVRHRDGAEGRQDLRPRQHVGHRSQGASGPRSGRRRARLPGRAVRGARHRRRERESRRSSRPTCCRKPSTAPIRRCCCSRRARELAAAVAAQIDDAEGAAHAPRDRRRRARASRARSSSPILRRRSRSRIATRRST